MKTEIFSFNELNVDGNGDYVQIVIQVTGSDFDYASISDHINVCTYIPFCVVEF